MHTEMVAIITSIEGTVGDCCPETTGDRHPGTFTGRMWTSDCGKKQREVTKGIYVLYT